MLISEEYREQNRQLHENPAYGVSGHKWAGMVQDMATARQCETVLDYGCGKQTLGRALPHLLIRGYDPAIDGLDDAPAPADLVICGDVMEHVEEDCVDEVLDDLERLTKKACLLVVSIRKAVKTLPDGRNAHITIRPAQWWLERIMQRFDITTFQVKDGKEFVCIGVKRVVQ